MSLRPPNPPKLQLSDLRPGDVLLSRAPDGSEGLLGLMDKLILELDEGDYTHSALYVGEDDGQHMVIEGIRKGITYESLDVDLDAQVIVDVYRFQSPDGKVLGEPGWPAEPVIVAAQNLVGGEYSYMELAMMAAMLLHDDFQYSGQTQIEKNQAIGELIQFICNVYYELTGKTAMTCVQVVTTAFFEAEAEPTGAYALHANDTVSRTPPQDTALVDGLARDMQVMASEVDHSDKLEKAKANAGQVAIGFPPVFTPRDLQLSPSLKLVGTLKEPGQ